MINFIHDGYMDKTMPDNDTHSTDVDAMLKMYGFLRDEIKQSILR